MTYQDSDFAIQKSSVLWRRLDGMILKLAHASKEDINYLENIGFCGTPGNPALYEVLRDMSRDCDEILIYDGQGNLLHRMEDKDGLHRGTTQKVHGSAAGSSSGSQSTGTAVTSTTTGGIPLYSGYSQYAGLGAGYVPGSGTFGALQGNVSNLQYQQMLQAKQQAMQVAQAQAAQNIYNAYPPMLLSGTGIVWTTTSTIESAPKKKIESDGIKIGEIVAYRCWPIKNGFLWSTAADRAWAPGEPMKAGENHLREGLGVYAFKDMSRCIHEFGGESFYRCGVAYGSIVLWGEIVEHQLGYRAEYAAVRSIEFVRNVDAQFWRPESVANLRALYKVEGK